MRRWVLIDTWQNRSTWSHLNWNRLDSSNLWLMVSLRHQDSKSASQVIVLVLKPDENRTESCIIGNCHPLSLSLSLCLKFVEISLGFGLDLLRSSEISSRSSEIWTRSFEIYERSHWYPTKSRLHYFGNFFKNQPSSRQAKTDLICAWCWSVAGVFLLHSI